ncbi:MAG: aspartyl protease family protein [candidate division Zixibacteria bacterium]|nr:aspartyl protease family protein [candidate division Zixibacteria bacterium]
MKTFITFSLVVILLILNPGLSWGITPEEILSKHQQALGGKETLLKIKTTCSKGKVKTSGLEGEFTFYSEFPDKSRQDIDFKIIQINSGTDGKIYWQKDQNGKIRELEKVEKSFAWTENYFSSYLHFFPEEYKRELTYLGEEKDSLGQYYILEIKPEGGEPRKLFINKETYLLDRYQQKIDITTATTYLSDYREIDGIKIPFHSLTTTGKPQYDADVFLTEVKFNLEVTPSLFQIPEEKVKDYTFSTPDGKTTIPFELANNHIYIEVLVNGNHSAYFLLDTGAGASCINLDFAKGIGLESTGKFEAKGVGGSEDAGFLELQTFQLGDITMSQQKVVSLNLSPMNIYEGREMDGIIGYDLLSRFVFEIDYQKSRLTFYDPQFFNYKGKGEALEIELYGNTPHLKATVDGKHEGMFTLDTGSRKSLDLHAPFVKENGFLKKYPDAIEAFGGAGIGGQTKSLQTRIRSIQIGTFLIKEPLCGLSLAEEGAFISEKTQGNIGGGILKRFNVTFDYENKKVFLEKNDLFEQKDELDKSGLMVMWEDGKFLVNQIYKGTPAEKARIEAGEEIISINDEPASKYTLNQLRDLFTGKDGTIIKLQLKKIDKLREVSFKLKSLI